ncbi:hypothetical protein [Peribacillus sp. Hz7]|uniref:hypothetical protein n=1 Tax=Peribacillus sp. Hz7 TaxID=3344873 RepID=UPI0035C9C0CC
MKKISVITNQVKFAILFMIIVIFFLNYSANNSYACSCVQPDSVKEELERNSAVFSGKVVEIVDENKNKSMQSSADSIAILFEVEETWKGLDQTQVIVYTERSSASCGYEFTLHKEYLVYAHEIDGALRVSLCSRTTSLSTAKKDLDELGKGKKPTEQVSIDSDVSMVEDQISSKDSVNNQIYIILLIVILLLIVVYITRRNKK